MLSDPELAERIAELQRACRARGVKVTHQRLEVLREVAQSQGHPSADMILEGVKRRLPTVSVDTVYRTLWLLTDLGLISTLAQRRDPVRFDANLAPHHHYVCVACGAIIDVASVELEKLGIPAKVEHLGSVETAHLEIRGVCSGCRTNGQPAGTQRRHPLTGCPGDSFGIRGP